MTQVAVPVPWGGAFLKYFIAVLAGLICLWQLPHRWCARQAASWYRCEPDRVAPLLRSVDRWVDQPLVRGQFNTGSTQFDGEWLFGTYMMAGMGYGQMAFQFPDQREHSLAGMERCIEALRSDAVRAFDIEMWGNDPLDTLTGNRYHHAAYLGYFNLVLSLHRNLDAESEYASLNDAISHALARRLAASRIHLLESYPGEAYPVDNSAVAASLGLFQRATGEDFDGLLERWEGHVRNRYIDPQTGLLIQAVDPLQGTKIDHPRGSGTALAVYFLSFSHPALSESLYGAVKEHLAGRFLGFGGVREYPVGLEGRGDIDSGPIFMGFGMSATGFSLAGARLNRDEDFFRRLYSTAHLCGAPSRAADRLEFVTGGPLGNAILLAMLTVPPRKVEHDLPARSY